MNLPRRLFGSTGWNATCIGFGGAPIGYLKTERDNVNAILNYLLDEGVNLIDTAAVYPGSEEAIAHAIGHRRKEFLLVSKCGNRVADFTDPAWSPALITKTIDRSLKLLNTQVIDVMLLHSCDLQTLERGDAVAALVAAQKAGKIRWAGYSGDNQAAAHAASLADISVIETSISVADQANIDAVLPIARQRKLGVIAKRPIANAAWKDPGDQRGIYAGYASEYHHRLKLMDLSPAQLGANDWPELALRFTLSVTGVHCAIIGTTSISNARTNLFNAEKGPLPRDAVEKIRLAFTRAKGNQDWPGQQ